MYIKEAIENLQNAMDGVIPAPAITLYKEEINLIIDAYKETEEQITVAKNLLTVASNIMQAQGNKNELFSNENDKLLDEILAKLSEEEKKNE